MGDSTAPSNLARPGRAASAGVLADKPVKQLRGVRPAGWNRTILVRAAAGNRRQAEEAQFREARCLATTGRPLAAAAARRRVTATASANSLILTAFGWGGCLSADMVDISSFGRRTPTADTTIRTEERCCG